MVTMMTASSARSVAESVEHTIALECLSSCYVNNNPTQTWTSNRTFKPLADNGQDINPLTEFNRIMTQYRLMGSTGNEKIFMKYTAGTTPTFELQIYDWNCLDAVWSQIVRITPAPVKVTIEDIYKPNL